MNQVIYSRVLIAYILLYLAACANQAIIYGGPKDETPPQLIQEKSTPNLKTNFQKEPILLFFDEFVKISEPTKNIIVTPPLTYNPKVESRGKKVVFQFSEREQLRENTTYIIQFGDAIQDITESNPAKNLRYIFSTGEILDSLVMKGRLLQLEDFKPIDKCLAMLYDTPDDSAVYKKKPLYFSRSDASGNFEMSFLVPGTYQIVALCDENNNYQFDSSKEKIGFYHQLVEIVQDTVTLDPIVMFNEPKKPLIQDIDSTLQGTLKIRFDQDISETEVEILQDSVDFIVGREGNTITIWHESPQVVRHTLNLKHEGDKRDSIRMISYPLKAVDQVKEKLTLSTKGSFRKTEHPDSTIVIQFSYPIRKIDLKQWSIKTKSDSIPQKFRITMDSTTSFFRNIEISPLPPGAYNLQIDTSGATSFYGFVNPLPIQSIIEVPQRNQFVNLTILLDSLDRSQAYLFKLLQKSGQLIDTWYIKDSTQVTKHFLAIMAGEYELEVIFDDNENGRWDGGHFLNKHLPEIRKKIKLETLKPEWDSNQTIVIGGKPKLINIEDLEDALEKADENSSEKNGQ